MTENSLSILHWLLVAAAPAVAALAIAFGAAPATRWGMVDHPGGRKSHEQSTPLVGGVAIFIAFVALALLGGGLPGYSKSFTVALLLTVAIGVADDVHEINHRSKFVAQIVAALIIVSGTSVHVERFGDLFGFGPVELGKWSYLVTVVAIIGLMNAVNMIDGLDGLAGSVVLVPVLLLSAAAFAGGDLRAVFELWLLAGTIVGFLCFNLRSPWRQRAAVFMGDTGGMLLGLMLAWYSIRIAGGAAPAIHPITAVWFLAVPLLDMGSVMLLRLFQRKSPFHADRQHLHHVLVDAGYSVSQVVGLMAGATLLLGALAWQAERAGAPEFVMFYAFMGLWAGYLLALSRPRQLARLVSRVVLPRRPAAGSS